MVADIIEVTVGWIHILSALFWLGGMIYFELILRPSLSGVSPEEIQKINQGIGKRFGPLAWLAIAVIAITGTIRTVQQSTLSGIDALLDMSDMTLNLKVAIFIVMVIIGGVSYFTIQKLPKAKSREEALEIQKRLVLLVRSNIILGIIVLFLAVGLREGGLI